MRHLITIITIFALTVSALFGEEVTTKKLDDVIHEIPKPGGGFITREVSKVRGYYRGKTLVLLEYDSELTLNADKKKSITKSTNYFVVAEGKKILRIEGGIFKISFVTSPWPIHINHVCGVKDGKGSGRSHISVPDIGFFEYLEFKDGKLLPLIDGEEFDKFKDINLQAIRKLLTKSASNKPE